MDDEEYSEWAEAIRNPVVVLEGVPLGKLHIRILLDMYNEEPFPYEGNLRGKIFILDSYKKVNPKMHLLEYGLVEPFPVRIGNAWYGLSNKGRECVRQLQMLQEITKEEW